MNIIETERLILREINMADTKEMLRLHSNPHVQRYTGEAIISSLEGIQDKIKERWRSIKPMGLAGGLHY